MLSHTGFNTRGLIIFLTNDGTVESFLMDMKLYKLLYILLGMALTQCHQYVLCS